MAPVSPALAVVTVSAALAIALAPPVPEEEATLALPPPPTPGLVKTVSLGRHAAAADLVWLRAAQFIGAPHSERVLYAGLEDWVHLAASVDPHFKTPYFHGSILLATLPGRQSAAASILADAEQNLVPDSCRAANECAQPDFTNPSDVREKCVPCPSLIEQECSWDIMLSSGFVAYFGQLDAQRASRFFCEARRRGGPEYLTPFSARLSNKATTCRELRRDLGGIVQQSAQGGSEMLQGGSEQLRILVNCEQESLKHAAQAFSLRKDRNPTSVAELLEEGLLEGPPWVPGPGACWNKKADGVLGFELGPCPRP